MLTAQKNSEILVLNRIIKQKLIGLHNKLSNTDELTLSEISLKESIRESINLHNRQAGVIHPGQFVSMVLTEEKKGHIGLSELKTEQLFLILNELSACLILESKLYSLLKNIKLKSGAPEYTELITNQKRIISLISQGLNSNDKFTKA